MKKYLKEILPAFILSLVTIFMFFIYEPIIMFANNTSDFWFDIYVLLSCNIIAFLVGFFIMFIGYNVVYWITRIFFKNKKIIKYTYLGFLFIGFVLFFVTYIQGNYLAFKLPVLDGTPINWNDYASQNIITIIVFIVISIISTVTIIKKKEKAVKIFTFVTVAIFVMLSISLLSTVLTKKDCLKRKEYTVMATTENINKYSKNKNFVIFMIDAVDSEKANDALERNEDLKKAFADFTYYPDTIGAYAFTRDTVPLVLSGVWNENETDWASYYNEAMNQSKLLELLENHKYNVNIYDNEIPFNTEKAWKIKNFSFDNKVDKWSFVKQEMKYDMFKYLPYCLKKYSKIESMDYNITRKENDESRIRFEWYNKTFYNGYIEQSFERSNDNEFKFIHIEGGHLPFDCDKDVNDKEGGTYEEKVEASLNVIRKYIEKLKENGVYDNTVIIVLADHGWKYDVVPEDLLERLNPVFFIKGFNEKHDEMVVSDEKVSFDYLQDMYKELLEDKKSNEIFSNIDTDRPRRFLLQLAFGYDKMEEYLQYGSGKDLSTVEKTENVYERK